MQWTNDQPIYQQVRDHVVSLIIDGVLKSGDPIPVSYTHLTLPTILRV